MMKEIIKGLAAAALLAVGAAAAPEAAAYKQACMKAKVGVGFVGKYRVAWGIGEDFVAAHAEGRPYHMDGATDWSGDVHLAQEQCVSLSEVPTGAHFVVQMRAGDNRALCHDWDNRDVFIEEKASGREELSLWLDVSGATPHSMRCKAWKFE